MALEGDFPPDLRVENEIKSLIAGGNKVVMACYTVTGSDSIFDWNGCTIYKKRISKLVYKSSVGALRFPLYFNFWRKHIKAVFDIEKPDAVHVHDLPLAKVGVEFKKNYGVKFVLDLHENWPAYLRVSHHANTFLGRMLSSNAQWEKYERFYCQNADGVICVIDEAKERIEDLGIESKKVFRIANYPVLSDFDNTVAIPLSNEKPILFYAGGIGEHRGLQYAVKALPSLVKHYPNIEFWILGKGNYKGVLENLALDLGVSKHVVFFGQVPYKTVLDSLNKCTLALIPHEKSDHTDTTIPHKLFQYMYAGKPVIASNCKPIERIVRDTQSGKTYQWNSPDDFANMVIESLENIDLYNANEIRRQINENYNWEHEANALCNLYKGFDKE